jgi:hypothetical protein
VAEHSTVRQFRCRDFDRTQTFAKTNRLRSIFVFSLFHVSDFSFFANREIEKFPFLFFPISLFTRRLSGIVQCQWGHTVVAGDDPCERVPATSRRGERSVT